MQMDYSLPEQFLVAAWRAAWPPAQPAMVVVSRAICKTIDASFDYALVCACLNLRKFSAPLRMLA
jgi:hypothetical protein